MKRETLVLEKIINCTCSFVQEEGGRANLPSKGGRKKDERG